MTEEQRAVYDLVAGGLSIRQAGDKLGIGHVAAKSRWRRAKQWAEADPSAQRAASSAGAATVPHSYWIKSDGVSAYFKTEQADDKRDLLADVAAAFENIPAYVPSDSSFAWSNLLTVYPVMDLHMGMYAWGEETGGDDYDLQLAENDIKRAFGRLASLTPANGDALLILGGDTLHADNQNNETPKSKHKLDVDGRQFKVLDTAVRAIAWMVDHLASRHAKVTVRVLAGNHDPASHLILTFALSERYRNVDRIVVDKSPMDLLMFRHGNSLIAAHHGDKSPPTRLAMMIADVCPFWSDVRHRHVLTGHIHHESARDFPGIKWESLRAFCPQDAFGAMFAPRRAMQAMVFDYNKGRVLVASDPIGRDEE